MKLAVLASVLLTSVIAAERKTLNEDQAKALAKWGMAYSQVIVEAATSSRPPASFDSTRTTEQVQRDLESLHNAYTSKRDLRRAGTDLLDATAEVGLSLLSATSPTGLVAHAILTQTKNQAINGLGRRLDAETRVYLAKSLSEIQTSSGLTLEKMSEMARKQPRKLQDTLRSIPAIQRLKAQLVDDPNAQAIVDETVIGAISSATRVAFNQLEAQQGDINAAKSDIKKLSQAFSRYKADTDAALDGLSNRAATLENSMTGVNQSMSKLQAQMKLGNEQTRAIGSILFHKGTPEEKLLLMNSGFELSLSAEHKADLTKVLNAQIQQDRFVHDMGRAVQGFSQVAQIAANLGVQGLGPVVDVAVKGNTIVASLLKQDYLSALVGLTGLFAPTPDPQTSFNKQLMTYLDTQFSEVNQKLATLIEGQKAIMRGLEAISKQIADSNRQLNERLDSIELAVNTNLDLTRVLTFKPVSKCDLLMQKLRAAGEAARIRRFDNPAAVERAARQWTTSDDLRTCADSLEDLFGEAFTGRGNVLEFQFADGSHNPFLDKNSSRSYYGSSDQVKAFLAAYDTTLKFLVKDRSELSRIDLLARLSRPSRTYSVYRRQPSSLATSGDSCGGSLLVSLREIACRTPSVSSLYPRASQSGTPLEWEANAANAMERPLAFRFVIHVAELANFFTPIADLAPKGRPMSIPELSRHYEEVKVSPQGRLISTGALQATSLAVAQWNMILGDYTASRIAATLAENGKSVAAVPFDEKAPDQKKMAQQILKWSPYLQQNVLMIVLHDRVASRLSPHVAETAIAFDVAVSALRAGSERPLAEMFDNRITFRLVDEKAGECRSPAKACIPVATLAGVDVPLPSGDDFASGRFLYPSAFLRLVGLQVELADKVASYEIGEDRDGATHVHSLLTALSPPLQR